MARRLTKNNWRWAHHFAAKRVVFIFPGIHKDCYLLTTKLEFNLILSCGTCAYITHIITFLLVLSSWFLVREWVYRCPLPSSYFKPRNGWDPFIPGRWCYLIYKTGTGPATYLPKWCSWWHDTDMPMLLVYHPTRVQEMSFCGPKPIAE